MNFTWGTLSSLAASIILSSNCSKEVADITWQLTRSAKKRKAYLAASHLQFFNESLNVLTIYSTNSPPKL